MKRLVIGLLMSLIVVTLSACGVRESSSKDTNSENVIITDNKEINNKIYEVYKDKISNIENIFEKNNIGFKYNDRDKNNDYDLNTSISYSKKSVTDDRGITSAAFGLVLNSDNNIDCISATIRINVDKNNITSNPFKVEDTIIFELSKELIEKSIDYTKINDDINKCITEGIEKSIINTYDNIDEEFNIESDKIYYIININP